MKSRKINFIRYALLSGVLLFSAGISAARADLPPLPVLVANVDVINDYKSPRTPPYTDYRQKRPPVDYLIDWGETALKPQAPQGNLLLAITRAALTEEEIPPSGGIVDLFTDEQDRLLRVEFEASFSFTHPQNRRSAVVTIKTYYETSIAESTSPAEADRIRIQVIKTGIERFDTEFRAQFAPLAKAGW